MKIVIAITLFAIVASGCVSQETRPPSPDAVWRRARVERVLVGAKLPNMLGLECASRFDSLQSTPDRLIVVRYFGSAGARWRQARVVRNPENLSLRVDDIVEINVLDCAATVSLLKRRDDRR